MQITPPETDEIELSPPRPTTSQRFYEWWRRFHRRKDVRIAGGAVFGIALLCAATCFYFYLRLAHIIDQRLAAGPFSDTTNIFSAPVRIAKGDSLTLEEFAAQLRHNGYTESRDNAEGWFAVHNGSVEVTPGPESASSSGPVVVEFSRQGVAHISSRDRRELPDFDLGPQLIANLSGNRERRHLVKFAEIPPSLVNALVSVEDKHFFHHSGFDPARILKAAYVDLRSGHKDQGASTLTMQLARGFWLEPGKRWKRKTGRVVITLHMEHS